MNIFTKIEQLIDLTESETALVDFIKHYPVEFSKMKMKEICQYCFISRSTIYRLCKKLGLEGLADLKLAVTSSLNAIQVQAPDYDFPIKANQPESVILNNMENLYVSTTNNTKNLIDIANIKAIAEIIESVDYIDIYTSAGNIFFAENFKFQMAEIGKHVHVPAEEYVQHLTAAQSNEKHIAIVISFGGRGQIIESVLSVLKSTQTKIVLITSTQSNNMQQYADYTIHMSSYENHYNKVSSFSTRLSLLYILDVLYATYFQLHFEENITYKTNVYKRMTMHRNKKLYKLKR